jgi:hypothetical protein
MINNYDRCCQYINDEPNYPISLGKILRMIMMKE